MILLKPTAICYQNLCNTFVRLLPNRSPSVAIVWLLPNRIRPSWGLSVEFVCGGACGHATTVVTPLQVPSPCGQCRPLYMVPIDKTQRLCNTHTKENPMLSKKQKFALGCGVTLCVASLIYIIVYHLVLYPIQQRTYNGVYGGIQTFFAIPLFYVTLSFLAVFLLRLVRKIPLKLMGIIGAILLLTYICMVVYTLFVQPHDSLFISALMFIDRYPMLYAVSGFFIGLSLLFQER